MLAFAPPARNAAEPVDLRRGHDGLVAIVRSEWKRFRMPTVPADATRVELDATTLAMLLDGIDVKHVRRPTPWTPSTDLATAP